MKVVSKTIAAFLFASILPAQQVGLVVGDNEIGILGFGSTKRGGFVTAITPKKTALCYVIETVGIPIYEISPLNNLDLVHVDLSRLLVMRPADDLMTGVEWYYTRKIPNDPSLAGLFITTQFLHIGAVEWRLSKGLFWRIDP